MRGDSLSFARPTKAISIFFSEKLFRSLSEGYLAAVTQFSTEEGIKEQYLSTGELHVLTHLILLLPGYHVPHTPQSMCNTAAKVTFETSQKY